MAYTHPTVTSTIYEINYVLCTRGHYIAPAPATRVQQCSPRTELRATILRKAHLRFQSAIGLPPIFGPRQ